jgi:hypothetical protein
MTDLADLSFFLSVLWQQSTGEEKSKKETREHIHESQTFFGATLSRFFFT